LIPNSIDVDMYSFRVRSRTEPHLVWLRAFHEIYNPSLAVRTVALLRKDFRSLQLRMLGPDKGDGSLQIALRTAAELGVTARVATPGMIAKSAVPKALSEQDIFLNTTNIDN